MDALRILVLSNPVTDALNGDGAGAEACKERFPQLDWRFVPFGAYTEEDVL